MVSTHNKLIHIIIALVLIVGFLGIVAYLMTSTPEKLPPPPETTQERQGLSIQQQLANQGKLQKFKNYDEITEFLEERGTGAGGYYGDVLKLSAPQEFVTDIGVGATIESFAEDSAGFGGASDDFSTTNIQVQGVDEADIIKSDGDYLYAVSGNTVYIVKSRPGAEAEVVSTIELESSPQGLYLNGDHLALYGNDNTIHEKEEYNSYIRRSSFTFVKVFDITDRTNPREVRDLSFEGWYTNSRMIGDYVYLLTNTPTFGIADDLPIPRILENGEAIIDNTQNGRCANCPDVFYIDVPYQSYNYINVAAVNIVDENEALSQEVYLLASGQNIFVSTENLYITYTKYLNEFNLIMEVTREVVFPRLSAKDQSRIRKIEAVDSFILSPDEKLSKISLIIERYGATLSKEELGALEEEVEARVKATYEDITKELEKTIIHKIRLDGSELEYRGSGEAPGSVLNQFSMDEHEGFFRIATTRGRTFSRFVEEAQESYSNVYILDEDLNIVGQVEELAKGERIFSVRFMQNRVYMVTFRQTDPLFVIDVGDPRNPHVLGELKIPGFSNYLHPYDDTTLIGFGRDADEDGITKGLKLSLFDVSDVANPTELDNYIWGTRSTNSTAIWDHRAFLFSRDKDLLVIPVENFNDIQTFDEGELFSPPLFPRKQFRGAYVFSVTKEDGFALRDKIDHAEDADDLVEDYRYGYPLYQTTVQRSGYIENELYTFSPRFIKFNALDDLSVISSVELQSKVIDTGIPTPIPLPLETIEE